MGGKIIVLLLLLFTDNCFGSYGSSLFDVSLTGLSTLEKKRVIINVDTGVDDYYALLILLDAEKQGLIKIEAIVCSTGNANITDSVRNVVRLLELVQRIDIPLYMGIRDPLILHNPLFPYFGNDGFGDLDYKKEPSLEIVRSKLAAEELNIIVAKNPGNISLLCFAPLSDVAITSKLYSSFFDNLKDTWILGGNYQLNQSGGPAEYNFNSDPEAAHIVFENNLSKSIYLYTLESFVKSTITYDWRYNVLNGKTPALALATRAEKSLKHELIEKYWTPADAFLAYCFVQPNNCNFNTDPRSVDVELHDANKRAWVLLDPQNKTRNVQLIESINEDAFKAYMLKIDL